MARPAGRAKVNPPIRGRAERERIWQHLAAGNVTVVSIDHVSWSADRKDNPDMLANASGRDRWSCCKALLLSMAHWRAVTASPGAAPPTTPAAIARAERRAGGRLRCGFVVLSHAPYTYFPRQRRQFHRLVSAPSTVSVARTMLRGQWVFADGEVLAEPTGRFVRPQELRCSS